ncbi:AcrR family transcriptional regulator [Streptomyces sp. 3330]|uniref:TetR/AcrR family transcriptional regulator n=1 Tax=Streptomyces sp. 3330 TaxID=2817755 RepID=UPI002862415E|nr:TetR family transcriptional regulator [Streptomyces sp. 3330]MDR6975689.1 AcrR family transcriptional regulator [Streptomyces sp. 3330]
MTAARSSSPADPPQPGLRERKKTKTREAIRTATYALVEEQGYDATTIDQIAERAEVSPSTVLRYFPTKEDIVLTGEQDPVLPALLRSRPTDEPLADTMRYVMREGARRGFDEDPEVARLRTRLMVQVPAVRSRMTESMSVLGRMLGTAIGERSGRAPDSLEVRVYTMSLLGGLMQTALYWGEHGHEGDFGALLDRAMDVLEHGLSNEKR